MPNKLILDPRWVVEMLNVARDCDCELDDVRVAITQELIVTGRAHGFTHEQMRQEFESINRWIERTWDIRTSLDNLRANLRMNSDA